ncbi:MAG TPA: recombinase family protein [Candidatus Limnocylindrales bacterium]
MANGAKVEEAVTGAAWSAETLREILLRPRNAGLTVYRGEILEGVAAPWEPIVSREVFEAVRTLLTDPERRTGPGAAPRWLGSGLYRCGKCSPPEAEGGKPVTCQVTLGGREPRYRCKDHNHLTRNVKLVDDLVFAHVVYAFTHPRAFTLLVPAAPEVDAEALHAERKAIRHRLEQMAEDEVLGLKTRDQVIAATRKATSRINEIDELLNTSVTADPLADVVNSVNPVATWRDLPTVTILPTGAGRRFDPTRVRIDPEHGLGAPVVAG